MMVTLVATYPQSSLRPDFLLQWGKAWLIDCPVAAATAFVTTPAAQRITSRLVALLE